MDNAVIVGTVPSVKSHTADLATRLVDEAGRILAAEGAGARPLRRLATVTGTSTMAVYTLFGDKNGLLSAMHREGFARLAAALHRASADPDPLEGLAPPGGGARSAGGRLPRDRARQPAPLRLDVRYGGPGVQSRRGRR